MKSLLQHWKAGYNTRHLAKLTRLHLCIAGYKSKQWGVGELFHKLQHPSCSGCSMMVDAYDTTRLMTVDVEEAMSMLMLIEAEHIDAIIVCLDDHSYHVHLA